LITSAKTSMRPNSIRNSPRVSAETCALEMVVSTYFAGGRASALSVPFVSFYLQKIGEPSRRAARRVGRYGRRGSRRTVRTVPAVGDAIRCRCTVRVPGGRPPRARRPSASRVLLGFHQRSGPGWCIGMASRPTGMGQGDGRSAISRPARQRQLTRRFSASNVAFFVLTMNQIRLDTQDADDKNGDWRVSSAVFGQ
jgi:hypothetical protein